MTYPLTGPATNAAGPTPRFVGDQWWCTQAAFSFTANTLYIHDGTAWTFLFAPGAMSVESFITSNVNITSANTATDITSISLGAGSWDIKAQAFIVDTAVSPTTTQWTVRILDATTSTVLSEMQQNNDALLQNQGMPFFLGRKRALTQTTTVKLQAFSGNTSSRANADPTNNGSGTHVTTGIWAVRIVA